MSDLDRIELARMSDAGAIALISRDQVEHGLQWRWTPRAIASAIRHAETEVIVARRGSILTGFALMRLGDVDAHLLLFGVRPEYRRQGIGCALFDWLEPLATTAGSRNINLEVRAANTGARRFYRDRGFTERHRVERYYQGIEDAVQMVFDLSTRTASSGRYRRDP